MLTNCGIDLPTTVVPEVWDRLREDFARRHVLTHSDGIVDEKFLTVVTGNLQVGQRLVVARLDAERALNELEAVLQQLAAHS